ncbi:MULTISPECIES: type I-E CRISPR-associated protein Cas7/Cse4/CasC [Streptomyces]|uniref:Type I-E CRISPR-associated protein Cas7/Cse4/CasC n=1 Tax=Streptomyces evansiae TaxID=3075535 RepID=A0ABU2QY83_9ACTN|nr:MULTISPECIES: type I-E CRISPR-associated protein Cas7/Cse4/CasC [unclassified Streptomyces]MDT0409408.1 type I-E CRISPR-associated protein Cas7/Cse4/CasC [Streptomyces sp. DSM 41979]MYQ59748.1 type I-E CRISPR-associated protein Cas7/Cse4/CasC [Streptomyces sp. SID4926]SCE38340.1 CRISPR system Cascade subunit CasC [Streptomyces sp. DfronAA-171]
MTRTIIDVHVLQSVPPSNLNRDDTGSPKSAFYGGVRRARVSSQAWKRATRQAFSAFLDPRELGVRTRQVPGLLASRIRDADSSLSEETAMNLAVETLSAATGSKFPVPLRKAEKAKKNDLPEPPPESTYLMFLSQRQLDGLAEHALNGAANIKAFFKDKTNKETAKKIADTQHSVDVALFGRMVADSTDLNVDAAAQVAHALSVHAVENESDYFTAVDDMNEDGEDSGAGMIGTVEFNSATLYRYAALDVDRLRDNLGTGVRPDEGGDQPVHRAVDAFLRAFVQSMPTGKANTFANQTLPDAVIVTLRSARPVSFVGAFEEPVVAPLGTGGHLRGACAQLVGYVSDIEKAYGVSGDPSWVLRAGTSTEPLAALGTAVGLEELVHEVGEAVAARLPGRTPENGVPEARTPEARTAPA